MMAIAMKCCTYDEKERPTFRDVGKMLKRPGTVRSVCGNRASVVEEDDGTTVAQAPRPMVRLKPPAPKHEKPKGPAPRGSIFSRGRNKKMDEEMQQV